MQCPHCGSPNPDGVAFCTRCHATLIFKCPKCWHEQNHGLKCDQCGADFSQLQGTSLAQVMAEEFRASQEEENRLNAAVFAASNPVVATVMFIVRWIYSRFLA
jgi:uncharacterized membrane protein YvbJ